MELKQHKGLSLALVLASATACSTPAGDEGEGTSSASASQSSGESSGSSESGEVSGPEGSESGDAETSTSGAEAEAEAEAESGGDGDGDADSGDGDGDGDGDSGDGDSGDGDGDSGDGDGDGDGDELATWVLTIYDESNGTHPLRRISVDSADIGTVTDICTDITFPASIGQTTNVTSLTFNQNVLYASVAGAQTGDTLVIVNPCTCTAELVGSYGYSLVNGITSNVSSDMLGISATSDVILDIDPASAASTVLSNLSTDWGSHGLTWSDAGSNLLYGIDATSDMLFEFSGSNGAELASRALDRDFGTVGIEYHPGVATLFTCSSAGELWSVDIPTGAVSTIADIGMPNCDNLAAPFGPVACIPQ